MIKKNKNLFLMFSLIAVILLINTGCKDFGVPEYNFIVTYGEGIGGLPAAGAYTYKELSSINYEYIFINDPERSPGVFVNDSSVSAASIGTIIMYRDIEMFVGDVDIRGSWKLTVIDTNDVKAESNVVFAGNGMLEGTFTDGEYEGTWVSLNNIITMIYTNIDDYKLVGGISPKYLGGTVYTAENNIGSWSMIK